MNLNGIGGSAAPIYRPDEGLRTLPDREGAHASAAAAVAADIRPLPVAASGLLAPRQAPAPSEAPEGTDPELWAILTAEERFFFSRMQVTGPLTYGRKAVVAHSQAPLARGGRIDVRV